MALLRLEGSPVLLPGPSSFSSGAVTTAGPHAAHGPPPDVAPSRGLPPGRLGAVGAWEGGVTRRGVEEEDDVEVDLFSLFRGLLDYG